MGGPLGAAHSTHGEQQIIFKRDPRALPLLLQDERRGLAAVQGEQRHRHYLKRIAPRSVTGIVAEAPPDEPMSLDEINDLTENAPALLYSPGITCLDKSPDRAAIEYCREKAGQN